MENKELEKLCSNFIDNIPMNFDGIMKMLKNWSYDKNEKECYISASIYPYELCEENEFIIPAIEKPDLIEEFDIFVAFIIKSDYEGNNCYESVKSIEINTNIEFGGQNDYFPLKSAMFLNDETKNFLNKIYIASKKMIKHFIERSKNCFRLTENDFTIDGETYENWYE